MLARNREIMHQKRQDFIYRVSPSISVKNIEGGDVFGEEELSFTDENLGVNDVIPAYDGDGEYTFGHPVFNQRGDYSMDISLYILVN